MNEDILEKYQLAKEDILSNRPTAFHYPLLEIMRTVTGERASPDNLASLEKSGIDPQEFRKIWELGFAKETLGPEHCDTSLTSFKWYAEVVESRCKTSLQTNDLPPEIQDRLREKLRLVQDGPRYNA